MPCNNDLPDIPEQFRDHLVVPEGRTADEALRDLNDRQAQWHEQPADAHQLTTRSEDGPEGFGLAGYCTCGWSTPPCPYMDAPLRVQSAHRHHLEDHARAEEAVARLAAHVSEGIGRTVDGLLADEATSAATDCGPSNPLQALDSKMAEFAATIGYRLETWQADVLAHLERYGSHPSPLDHVRRQQRAADVTLPPLLFSHQGDPIGVDADVTDDGTITWTATDGSHVVAGDKGKVLDWLTRGIDVADDPDALAEWRDELTAEFEQDEVDGYRFATLHPTPPRQPGWPDYRPWLAGATALAWILLLIRRARHAR